MKKILLSIALGGLTLARMLGEDVHVIYESAEADRMNNLAEQVEAQVEANTTAQQREKYLGKSYYTDKFKSNIHVTDVKPNEIDYCVQNTGQVYQTTTAEFEQGRANGSLRLVEASYATAIKVDLGDVLKIRSGPGTRFNAIAGIPAGASDINLFEAEQVWDGDTWWIPVQWHGFRGYVGKSHLEIVR